MALDLSAFPQCMDRFPLYSPPVYDIGDFVKWPVHTPHCRLRKRPMSSPAAGLASGMLHTHFPTAPMAVSAVAVCCVSASFLKRRFWQKRPGPSKVPALVKVMGKEKPALAQGPAPPAKRMSKAEWMASQAKTSRGRATVIGIETAKERPFRHLQLRFVQPSTFAAAASSVFAETPADEPVQLDLDLLKAVVVETKVLAKDDARAWKRPQDKGKSVLNDSRVMQITIFLSKLKMSPTALTEKVRLLHPADEDDELISPEIVLLLKEAALTWQEKQLLLPYRNKAADLRRSEQSLLPLIELETHHVRAICFDRLLDVTIADLTSRVIAMSKAAQEIMTSKPLKKVILLVLNVGNFLNGCDGTAAAVKTFAFESVFELCKLKVNVKKNINALHFVALSMGVPQDVFVESLQTVPQAAKDDLASLQNELSSFSADLDFLRCRLVSLVEPHQKERETGMELAREEAERRAMEGHDLHANPAVLGKSETPPGLRWPSETEVLTPAWCEQELFLTRLQALVEKGSKHQRAMQNTYAEMLCKLTKAVQFLEPTTAKAGKGPGPVVVTGKGSAGPCSAAAKAAKRQANTVFGLQLTPRVFSRQVTPQAFSRQVTPQVLSCQVTPRAFSRQVTQEVVLSSRVTASPNCRASPRALAGRLAKTPRATAAQLSQTPRTRSPQRGQTALTSSLKPETLLQQVADFMVRFQAAWTEAEKQKVQWGLTEAPQRPKRRRDSAQPSVLRVPIPQRRPLKQQAGRKPSAAKLQGRQITDKEEPRVPLLNLKAGQDAGVPSSGALFNRDALSARLKACGLLNEDSMSPACDEDNLEAITELPTPVTRRSEASGDGSTAATPIPTARVSTSKENPRVPPLNLKNLARLEPPQELGNASVDDDALSEQSEATSVGLCGE